MCLEAVGGNAELCVIEIKFGESDAVISGGTELSKRSWGTGRLWTFELRKKGCEKGMRLKENLGRVRLEMGKLNVRKRLAECCVRFA